MSRKDELKLLYPSEESPDAALNIVVVPGMGLLSPEDWSNATGVWLKALREPHGEKVQVWHYAHELVKGQSILRELLRQSHKLAKELHRLNPEDVTLGQGVDHAVPKKPAYRPILMICQSLGGLIWKEAFANMYEKKWANKSVIENVVGSVFLGTPHAEELDREGDNIIEIIVRASKSSPHFTSFTREDNQRIVRISEGFSSFQGHVVSTYETVESKSKWKGPFLRGRMVVTRERATFYSNPAAKLYGIASSHGDLCKVVIGGELYEAIAQIVHASVLEYTTASTPQSSAGASEHDVDGSVLDGWDIQSLRSHRSRMANPLVALTQTPSNEDLPVLPVLPVRQSQGPTQAGLALPSVQQTSAASAGYSSQFSYEMVPSANPLELDKPKLSIPCFSVGTQSPRPIFYGRDAILQSIDKSLLPDSLTLPADEQPVHASSNLKTFALCGAGGIGKTEIASQYIHTRRHKYSAIFWVTADTRNALLEDFARIAVELGLQDKDEAADLAEACELVKGWLCNPVKDVEAPLGPENEVAWLLVLDNVDDWGTIDYFWPTTGIGSILMTSRDPLSRSHIYTAKQGLDLEPLSSSEAIQFLDVVSEKHFKGSQTSAKAVAEWSGGLPLIMTAIASTMSNQDLTYNSMLELLKARSFEAVSTDAEQEVHETPPPTIASMIGIACLDEHTASLIRALSFLNPESIPQKFLIDYSDRAHLEAYPKTHAQLDTAQAKLQQSSLITFNESTKTVRMHRIYQDIVRESLSPEMRVKALLTSLELVSEAWVYQPLEHRFNTTRYEACSAVFPHVDRIFQHYEEMFKSHSIDPQEEAAALFNDAGWYWFERGFAQESKPFCRLAQSICEALQKKEYSEKVAKMLRESHNNQGSAANETNDPKESLEHNRKWLSLMRQRKSPDGSPIVDYELGCVYNEVGVAYAMNGLYDLALELFKQSMSTYTSLPDYDEKWLGWPLPNIGMVHWIEKNYSTALDALHRMREIYQDAYGRDDTQSFKTGKVLYGIGNVYLSLGDLDQALEYHVRSLNQWSQTLGAGHHRIGDVSHKIAQDLMGQGHFDKAQEYLTQSLRIFARRPYYKHEYARTIFRQGQLQLARGESELAEQSFKAAHNQHQSLVPQDTRPWDEILEEDYDNLVIFMSR